MKNLKVIQQDSVSKQLDEICISPLHYGLLSGQDFAVKERIFLPHSRMLIGIAGTIQVHIEASLCMTLHAHDTIFLPPNSIYYLQCDSEARFILIDYTVEKTDSITRLRHQHNLFDLHIFPNLLSERQISNLIHLAETSEQEFPGTYILVRSMIYRIFIVAMLYQKEHALKPIYSHAMNPREKVLQTCIQYIEEHVQENINVDQLAKELHYSPNYLYKVFKENLGLSCKEYILQYKLKRTLYELGSTEDSIQSIAHRFGFSSLYHFSKVFHKQYGLSPSQYRSKLKQYR